MGFFILIDVFITSLSRNPLYFTLASPLPTHVQQKNSNTMIDMASYSIQTWFNFARYSLE